MIRFDGVYKERGAEHGPKYLRFYKANNAVRGYRDGFNPMFKVGSPGTARRVSTWFSSDPKINKDTQSLGIGTYSLWEG